MKRNITFALPALALLIACPVLPSPARAQTAGDAGFEQMQQFAPMLEMMKKKLGKKRFALLMQTLGPMMSKMMDGQGGGFGGSGFAGFGGNSFGGFGGGSGGFDMSSMAGMMNPETISAMMQMFGSDDFTTHHQRRHHKKIKHAHL